MSDIGKPLKRHTVIPLRQPQPEQLPAPDKVEEKEKEDA